MSVDSLLIVSPGAFQAYGHQHSYVAGLKHPAPRLCAIGIANPGLGD